MIHRQRLWRQLPYNTRVALRRLHHAPPSAVQRLLRTAGADQDAILEDWTISVAQYVRKSESQARQQL